MSDNLARIPNGQLLWPKMKPHVTASIQAYFDIDGSNECKRLYDYISTFVEYCCDELDLLVFELAANKEGGKNIVDWSSIYVMFMKNILAGTIGNFSSSVIDNESLVASASRKIPCSKGYSNRDRLQKCYAKAHSDAQIDYANRRPNSAKARKKREGHEKISAWPFKINVIACAC
ncbi:MAG: hypothetical protein KI789_01475 [Hoeflea sp.]|nr:hypothetical protein [Hoeflea sp.]